MNDLNNLKKFARKDYRDGFMQTQVRGGIAFQVRALRRKLRLTQSEVAKKTSKTQSVVSRLENTEYGKVSVQTLLDIASGLDVALLVQFVSYPDFLQRTSDMTDKGLQPETIKESLELATKRENQRLATVSTIPIADFTQENRPQSFLGNAKLAPEQAPGQIQLANSPNLSQRQFQQIG